jgi:hypothetical protein
MDYVDKDVLEDAHVIAWHNLESKEEIEKQIIEYLKKVILF